MFFSICIPQYGRYEHLKRQLERLQEQTCQDFEVCISDDRSPEKRWDEMRSWLVQSGIPHTYKVQETNLRYDGNLRAAIGLASGKYVLLMGNDDRLATPNTLADVKARLESAGFPEVVLTNYLELSSSRVFSRVTTDGQMVSGLNAALASYRNYSFVSGILILRERAQPEATPEWDGSEMYQMGLASRIVASGGRLFGINAVCVEKDIQLPGLMVDSYVTNKSHQATWRNWWNGTKKIPLVRYAATAWRAVSPHCPKDRQIEVAFGILKQTLSTTYPFWIIEYKRTFGLKHAIGLALGMRPRALLSGFPAACRLRLKVRLLYGSVTLTALLLPVRVFKSLEPSLHARFKRITWKRT